MKNLFIYVIFFSIFISIESRSSESDPYNKNIEDVFNVGQMQSHDKKFTLFSNFWCKYI